MSNIIKYYTNQNNKTCEDFLSEKTLQEYIEETYAEHYKDAMKKAGYIGVMKKVLCNEEEFFVLLTKTGYHQPEDLITDLFNIYGRTLFTSKVKKSIASYYAPKAEDADS